MAVKTVHRNSVAIFILLLYSAFYIHLDDTKISLSWFKSLMWKRKSSGLNFTKDFHGCLKLGLNSYTNRLFKALFEKDANESFIVTLAWIHLFACPGGLICVHWKAFGISQLCHRIKSRRKNPLILYYPNYSATFQLLLRAGDIALNPEPVSVENPSQETRKKSSKQSSRTPAPVCLQCLRGVQCNEKRFFCVVCKDLTHAWCTGITNINYIKPTRAEEWTCPKCLISVLPFYGQNTLHASVSPRNEVDTTLAEDLHLEALKQNSKQLTVMHINTQSMISTFDDLLLAVDRYKFDVITMRETSLKENHLLLQYVTIPGYTHAFNNRHKKRGGGVGVYIKDSIKFKRRSKEISHLRTLVAGNPSLQ